MLEDILQTMKHKILIISAFPPSRKSAGQNFTRMFLESLGINQDLSITHLYFSFNNDSAKYDKMPKNIEEVKINNSMVCRFINYILLFFMNPLFIKRLNFKLILFLLKNKRNYDLFILNYSQVFIYSLFIPNEKKILIAHDVIYQLFSRKKGFIWKIFKYTAFLTEKLVLSLPNTEIFTFSKKDKALIDKLYKKSSNVIHVYLPEEIYNIEINHYDKKSICMFGAWNRRENFESLIFFIEKIYPLLNEEIQEFKIRIIGSGLSEDFIKKIKKYKNIEVYGFVNNPYKIISESQILVAPLFEGAGVKAKVIESLACGTPVVGTEIAFEGIEFDKGLYLAKSPTEYVQIIKELFNDVDLKYKNELRMEFLKFYQDYEKKLDYIIIKKLQE